MKYIRFIYFITLVVVHFVTASDEIVFEEVDTPIRTANIEPYVPSTATTITLELPLIGNIDFKPATPPQKGLQAEMPQLRQKKIIGPLTIEKGIFSIFDGKISYLAHGTLFNKEVRIGLKELGKIKKEGTLIEASVAQFGIEFISHPTLDILGQTVSITAADIILQENKPATIRLSFKLFNQVVIARLSVQSDSSTLGFELHHVTLASLIPQLQTTPFANVMIKNATVAFDIVPGSKSDKNATAYISGQADLSSLKLSTKTTNSDVVLAGKINKQALNLEINVPQIDLPVVGTLNNGKLAITREANKPVSAQIVIDGKIALPNFDPIDAQIDATITPKGITFEGTSEGTLTFENFIVKKVHLSLDTETKTLLINGIMDVFGYQFNITFKDNGVGSLSAEGPILTDKQFKPFSESKIPEIANIVLEEPRLAISVHGDNYDLAFSGYVTLSKTRMKATLHVSSGMGSLMNGFMEVALPPSWTLSQLIPSAKNTALDNIVFDQAELVVTMKDFSDDERSVDFKSGINLYARAKEEGPLKPLGDLTKEKNGEITFVGSLAVNLPDSVLQASVPISIPLKTNVINLNKLGLALQFNPPTLELSGTMAVKPTPKDDWLYFTATSDLSTESIELAGSLHGDWKNPFGVQNFVLSDVAAQLIINYKLLASTGLPDSLGMTGKFTIAGRHASLAASAQITKMENLVLAGSFDKLELSDFVALGAKIVNKPINISSIPEIGIDDVKFYLVPKQTQIGVFNFDEGLSLEGTLHVPNFETHGKLTIEPNGIKGEGYAKKTQLGALLVSGAGPDKTYGTPDDGPFISLILTPLEQKLYATAYVELGTIFKGTTTIDFGIDKMSFMLDTKIKNLFDAHIIAQAALIHNPDIKLLIEFKSDFMNYLQTQINAGLSDMQRRADRDLSDAQSKLAPLQKKWDEYTAQINEKSARIDKLNAIIKQKGIVETVPESAEVAKLGIEIGGLEVARGTIKAAYETAKGTLEGLKQTAYYAVGEGGKLFTKNLLNAIQINYVKFEGSAQDIIGGVFPNLSITLTVFGKQRQMTNVRFDLNHPEQSARDIANAVLKFVS